jgi:PAS domain S-box-containing protein
MISSRTTMKIVPAVRQNIAVRIMSSVPASIQSYATASTSIKQGQWSNQLSFASPESDFTFVNVKDGSTSRQMSTSTTVWSNQLSFTSPESDFTSIHAKAGANRQMSTSINIWSNQLSFTSPESDFTGANVGAARQLSTTVSSASWSNQLSFASPESDFVGQLVPDAIAIHQQERSRLVTVDSSSSSLLSSLVSMVVGGVPQQDAHKAANVPKTFKEALQRYQDAIIVTTATAPHTIIYVNKAWEEMCGFKAIEVLDKTLDCIQGPKTNVKLAATSLNKLVNTDSKEKEPIDMYLINYRKDGTSFTNHVTIGAMTLNERTAEPNFLVGILEEVPADQVPLRMIY